MRYYRCKCGNETAWSSMGVAACQACAECHSTLAESPNSHAQPEPHDWTEHWKEGPASSEPQKERICRRCMAREDITEANARALTVWVDGVPLWMPSPDVRGKDLKIARRIDPAFSFWREGDGLTPIGDDDSITLTEGDRFMSSPPGHF